MKKRILPYILLVIMCFGVLRPLHVQAAEPLDPEAQASLTLHYQKDSIAFAGLQIGIYRIAEAFPDGSFGLIEPFSSYPVDIHGITAQEQWQHVAQTLCSCIVAGQIAPDCETKTDPEGTASFPGLKTGLYFVREVVAENNGGTYIFNQFLVYVPTPRPDGSFDYEVEANPKSTNFVPKTQYTVTKLWQDNSNQHTRPDAVTVDIYQDGVLWETQILNSDNHWTYTWHVSGDTQGQWTVMEKDVPDGYKVRIQQTGSTFSIINTCQTTPETPPTGDSFSPLFWIMLMCFSGITLVILGVYSRRRK